jgi:S-(hydroxymethyl)glutathione dehydrogenase / alcohol dehydrogenase
VKAALLRSIGAPLEVADVKLADPAPHQVRVRIAASGVCHSDLSVQMGWLPFTPPLVLGHEGAGVVEEVGSAVTRVRAGDHVVIAVVAPCRACRWCLGGQPHLCYRGMMDALAGPYGTIDGEPIRAGMGTATFGEETLVLERQAIRIDPDLPLDVAALVGCAVTTGVGAVINTARVEPGSIVAIIGCGGVGLSVLQGAKLAGAAQIIGIDRVASRLAAAKRLGATDTMDAGAEDPVEAVLSLTRGGVDHAFEVVGRGETIKQALEMTRPGGTTTLVGAPPIDEEVTFKAAALFGAGKRILGCVYGSTDAERDFPRLLDLYKSGRLELDELVTRRISLEEVNDAFRAMEAGEGIRSVITFDSTLVR